MLALSQDGDGVQSVPVSATTTADPKKSNQNSDSRRQNANTVPTASNGTATTNEDTDHAFSASEFNYSDSDSDTLASVKITELPAADRGTLTLDGTAINLADLPKTITKAELDDGKLKYSPPADANGTGYASFRFRVNDGSADSTDAHTMTISVTAVNDPATGAPAISGTAGVGETLTATTSSITDLDGLPSSFTHQWKRFAADGTTFEANIGIDSDTYTLTESELDARVKVEVSFADNGGNIEGPLISDAYPSDGTVEAAEGEPLIAEQQQSSDATLLSNLTQTASNRSETGLMAQQFTAGASDTGWDLSQVRVTFNSAANGQVTVTVREDSGGAPGPIKYTLSLASNTSPILNFTTTTTVNFDAPEDAKLYAGAKCWVVVAPSAATEIYYPPVSADKVDSGAAAGWTFNGRVNTQPISGTSFLGHPFNATLQMAIVGHETSEILVSNSG